MDNIWIMPFKFRFRNVICMEYEMKLKKNLNFGNFLFYLSVSPTLLLLTMLVLWTMRQ